MQDIVLVDNASYSFGFQIDNGIPCIPFYNSKDDTELVTLGKYLRELDREKDVRALNRRHFRLRVFVESANINEVYDKLFN